MRDGTFGEIETELTRLMRRAESTRRATPVAAHRALDRAAYAILRHLHEAGPQNVSVLADALHLDGSTVTRQVGAMQRAGLVERGADPRDRRGTLVSATATGLARMAAVRRAREELYRRMLAGWPEADRTRLGTLLRRLNEAMDAYARHRWPSETPPIGDSTTIGDLPS